MIRVKASYMTAVAGQWLLWFILSANSKAQMSRYLKTSCHSEYWENYHLK